MFSCWKFLVVRPDTLSLVVNIDVNYSGAWPVIHLNFKVASRDSCVFTRSQRRFLNTGEIIMVYFFTLQILLATKFWSYCKLRTFQAVRWMTIPTKSNTVYWKRARLLRFQVQSNLAISNSVNSKSPLFRRKIECPWIYPSPLRFPGYFEAPLFRTFFHFPWDFEIAGFDCIYIYIYTLNYSRPF